MIKTKRWDEEWPKDHAKRDPSGGMRILICRYRPRALRKEFETWDVWCKALGPSKELHAAFYGKHGPPILLREYVERYLKEMSEAEPREKIAELAREVSAGKTITLLCSSACTDPAKCHRTLLKGLIEARIEAR